MTPYYQDERVTLYHGRCEDVLPLLAPESMDLLFTDPPYAGLTGGYRHRFRGVAAVERDSVSVGDLWQASLEWVPAAVTPVRLGAVVFCTHHSLSATEAAFAPWRSVMLLTWYKRNAPPTGKNVPRFTTEFAWCFARRPGLTWDRFDSTMADVPNLAGGCMATERIVDAGGRPIHPTQKPVGLTRYWLGRTGALSVLDPFAGSGTTLRAAKDLGVRAVGVEINERYCEIAAMRLSQEVLDLDGAA